MSTRPRRSIGSQRNPASEDAILQAAHEILSTDGLTGFTIEAIARRARAGKPTVYRWWPSRAHLLLAVFERHKEPFPEPDTGTLEGDIVAFLTFLLDCWRETPAGTLFRSIVAEAQTSEVAARALAEYNESRRARNAQWLAKHVPPQDATILAELLAAYALQRLASGKLDARDGDASRVAQFLARIGRNAPSTRRASSGGR